MKRSALFLALAATLALGACSDNAKRDDGTAGDAVTDIDKAREDGGVKSDAVVIDNDAGPTVSANADSANAAADTTAR